MKRISDYSDSCQHRDAEKRVVMYTSDADLLTYDPLDTDSFIHKLYEYNKWV